MGCCMSCYGGFRSPQPRMNVDLVRSALQALHSLTVSPDDIPRFWDPGFCLRSNGSSYDCAGLVRMLKERQAHLNPPTVRFVDIFGKNDWVAAWRTASLTTKEGKQAPSLVLVDVWHVKEGKIVSGEQCWQELRVGDELALTPHEADTEAVVLGALEGLEGLVLGQGTVEPLWAPEVEGHVDGVALDLDALRRHWAALKASLASLAVEVKQMVVQGSVVGAVYHVAATKKAGGSCEVQVVAVFTVVHRSKIASCQAVSRLVSGSPGDEGLATLELQA